MNALVERLGPVIVPDGDPREAEGTLNPAGARARDGKLLIYPRDVAKGNISRVGRVHVDYQNGAFSVARDGFALEPTAPYEQRPSPGYGCEDPRTTFVPVLDRYVMAYTAFGPAGPRIALALSQDGYDWERLGLMRFDSPEWSTVTTKMRHSFPSRYSHRAVFHRLRSIIARCYIFPPSTDALRFR